MKSSLCQRHYDGMDPAANAANITITIEDDCCLCRNNAKRKDAYENLHRRIGTFTVSRKLLWEAPLAVQAIFRHLDFIPVRAEMMYVSDNFEYQGFSPKFALMPDGQIPPEYVITVSKGEIDGDIEVVDYVITVEPAKGLPFQEVAQ